MIFCGLLVANSISDGAENEFPGGVADVAAQEAQRRQARVKSAQTLFTSGSNAFSDQSYGEAMDYFKAAFDTIPSVPAVVDQRRIFFQRYQAASLAFTNLLISEAKWAEAEATLAAVFELAEDSGVPDSILDPDVKRNLADIRSHDDRYNKALSPQHLREVELVNSKVILGKGFLDLGDYDRAERAYHEALAVDPYNTAARRGLENIERNKMNYADAAYDHTRAKSLRQVAALWASPVPLMNTSGDFLMNGGGAVAESGSVKIEQKLKNIIIPKLEFNNARLIDVLQFLTQKSQELDNAESDPLKRGVNIVVDSAPDASGADSSQRSLSVRISNVPLGVALQYVTGQVDMKYRVDAFAVTVVPMSSDIEGALVTRAYVVPPGFISGGAQGGVAAAGPVDPFATPDDSGGGALVKRISARDYLIKSGIAFGEGSNARYIPATSKLVVRNTVDQQRAIQGLIASAKAGGDKMVMVSVKMISIESTALNQLGMDFLLGQSNFGSTPRAFFGGGTDGNATAPTNGVDYPLVAPGGAPIGLLPVTSGLRTGDVSSARTIDDLLQGNTVNPATTKAPGIFGIAGAFTDPQFQMVLRGLSQLKGNDTLCDIKVPTKPGQIAKIEQVREFIYPTEYDPPEIPNDTTPIIGNTRLIGFESSGIIPATPATPTAFETRSVGKIIEVEPTVSQDNQTVNVNITLDISEFVGFINYGTPILNSNFVDLAGNASVITPNEILMPVFDAVKETTNVDVWDGQTIAIGGLHGEGITATNDKVPFIGDLPVLGRAFRSSTSESTKRALVIFITVRLVDPGGSPINNFETDEELYSAREASPSRSIAPVVNAPR